MKKLKSYDLLMRLMYVCKANFITKKNTKSIKIKSMNVLDVHIKSNICDYPARPHISSVAITLSFLLKILGVYSL